MKTTPTLVSVLAIVGAAEAGAQDKARPAEPTTVTLKVSGMSCSICATTVERTAKRLRGVTAVRASQPRGEAEVSYDATKTTAEDIKSSSPRTPGSKWRLPRVRNRAVRSTPLCFAIEEMASQGAASEFLEFNGRADFAGSTNRLRFAQPATATAPASWRVRRTAESFRVGHAPIAADTSRTARRRYPPAAARHPACPWPQSCGGDRRDRRH